MSATKKARKLRKATPKPAAETVPLASVSITIQKPRIFSADEARTVTFSGQRLARTLRYIALACPNVDLFTEPDYGIELAGIADICNGLSESDLHAAPVDCNSVFNALYQRLADLAARMNAKESHNDSATLTITRKPAEVTS